MPDAAPLVVGVDLGTLSGRAVVVRADDGTELGTASHAYEHGVLDTALPDGTPLGPDWALQVPGDYLSVLRYAVPAALQAADVDPARVVAIGVDATSCTMVPTTRDGTPVCELPGRAGHAFAHALLWKHHAAQPQADRINELARRRAAPWLARYGGAVSSEWQLPKALQLLEEGGEPPERLVEAADWVVWRLTGRHSRNACAAGYKGLVQDGAGPDAAFLAELHPGLPGLVAAVTGDLLAPGAPAGRLTAEAASWTGLPEGIVVAAGLVDAHATAPAAQATRPGRLLAILGTSGCHLVTSEDLHEVPGMSGAVLGGIAPGLWGYEAGQSGLGDILDWCAATHAPPSYAEEARRRGTEVQELLATLAAAQPVGAHGLLALDWHSGNRSVLVDHALSGLVMGQTLATRPEDLYRAHVEATAFGTRTIVEAYRASGIAVDEVVVAGGLTANPLVMRVFADVLGRPLLRVRSRHATALGAAIHAAVAAGLHDDVHAAGDAMGGTEPADHRPARDDVAAYDAMYADYLALHDHFGRGGTDVMRRLRERRRSALAAAGERAT